MIDKTIIDIERGIMTCSSMISLYKKLLGKFLVLAEFDRLRDSIATGNNHDCDVLAHTIKGVAGNLALMRLFEVSSLLMNQFRSNTPNQATIAEFWQVKDLTFAAVNEYLGQ
jgi:HPt (histidine-containing phosphotransfer) domain-containing protein